MSLNYLADDTTKKEWMNINCDKIICNEISYSTPAVKLGSNGG